MKKDIIKLTESFLKKDIFEEINKEKKRLKRIRFIYSILLLFLIII
jgi:predicted nucleic acid-binding Zn ribbon protein